MESSTAKSLARFSRLTALFAYIDAHWRYPRAEKRDLRLDFLRGFAVFVMVVDHFGGASWLYYLTGNNSFFTSGAEAFVLISGMVVGIVYGNIAEREGIRAAMLKALKRAWTLYKLTVVMTLTLAVLSDIFDLPWSKGVDLGDPVMFTLRVIVLQQTYYLADVPMLYTLLMALAPIGLWLLCQGRTGVLHILSFAVWAGFQYVDSQQIIILPIIGNTTFHPAAWQLIFFWAMAVGWHRDQIWARIRSYPRWPYFLVWTLLFVWLIHLYSSDLAGLKRLYPGIDVEWIVANLFSKSHVAPGRMLATVIVFQFAYLLLTLFWVPFQRALGWLLMPLGQNSLYSYTMHVAIIGGFYMLLPYLPGHITERGLINTSLQLGVLLLLWWMIRRQFAFDIVPR
ncbi:MAG: OpgC domain-containing protein [Chloroflexi bacterium]|nr:OpgC domain-containing protein [Chloroflexota bacterium]